MDLIGSSSSVLSSSHCLVVGNCTHGHALFLSVAVVTSDTS